MRPWILRFPPILLPRETPILWEAYWNGVSSAGVLTNSTATLTLQKTHQADSSSSFLGIPLETSLSGASSFWKTISFTTGLKQARLINTFPVTFFFLEVTITWVLYPLLEVPGDMQIQGPRRQIRWNLPAHILGYSPVADVKWFTQSASFISTFTCVTYTSIHPLVIWHNHWTWQLIVTG